MSGKGSAQRPTDKEAFDRNFDWAFDIMCKRCEYMAINSGREGHCYMFRDKPKEICARFKDAGITCKRCGKTGLQHGSIHTCTPLVKKEEKLNGK